jgi:hypothetical protein
VPELIEIGLDALNPLEVKAGMNPVGLKQSTAGIWFSMAASTRCSGMIGKKSKLK